MRSWRRHWPAALLLSVLLVWTGCSALRYHRGNAAAAQHGSATSTNHFDSSVSAEAQKTANTNAAPSKPADNTANNKTEENRDTLTPMDQGEGPLDRQITQVIRRAVVTGKGGPSFSFLAQNIKIITVNSVVTLRGVVNDAAEKTRIEALAKQTRGVKKVNDQLEVKGAKADSPP